MTAIVGEIIGYHPHVFIAAPSHKLAARRRLALDDIAGETLLLREQGSGTRLLMERTLQTAQIETRTTMEIGDNEAIKQAVMAGLGIAFVSAHTIAAEYAANELAVLPIQSFPVMRQWYVVHAKPKTLMPAGRAMWDFIANRGHGFLPSVATGNARS